MPIGDAYISAICDKCEEVSDQVGMTYLAGGSWDDRNVLAELKRHGWKIDGKITLCPECVEGNA